jgi:hypothetical protein
MADDTTVDVSIGADASGVKEGAAEASAAIASVGPAADGLAAAIQNLANSTAAGFAAMTAASNKSAHEIEHDLEEEELSLASVAETMMKVRESLLGFGEAVAGFFLVEKIVDWAKEIAEAGEKAEQLGDRLNMTTTQVQKWEAVATMTGRSSDQFAGATTRLTNAATRAAAGGKEQIAAFKELGISAQDATNPYNLLLEVADKFAEMHKAGETAKEIGVSMRLMGRSGAEMIPIFDEGREGIEEMMEAGVKFGTVLTTAQNVAVGEAAEKLNLMKLQIKGLSEQAFIQVIPLVIATAQAVGNMATAIEKAIQPGTFLREVIDHIGLAAIALATGAVAYLAYSLGAMGIAALGSTGVLAALSATMGTGTGIATVLAGALQGATVAMVEMAGAALLNPLVGIIAGVGALTWAILELTGKTKQEKVADEELKKAIDDHTNATAALVYQTKEQRAASLAKEQADLRALQATLANTKATLQGEMALAQQHNTLLNHALALLQGAQAGGIFVGQEVALGKAIGATTAQIADQVKQIEQLKKSIQDNLNFKAPPPAKLDGPSGAKQQKDQMQEWAQELHSSEEKMAEDTGKFMKDMTDFELQFWQKKLDAAKDGSKEWLAVKDKMFELHKTAQQRDYENEMELDRRNLDLMKNSEVGTLAIYDSMISSTIAKTDAGDAKMVRLEQEKDDAIKRFAKQAMDERIAFMDQIVKSQEKADADELKITKAANEEAVKDAQEKYKEHELNARGLTARLVALAVQESDAEQAEALKVLQLRVKNDALIMSQNESTTEEYKKHKQDELAAETEYNDKIVQAAIAMNRKIKDATDQEAKEFRTAWDAAVNPVVHTFTTGFLAMAEGTKSFAQVMRQIGQQILEEFIAQVIDKMIEKWLWKEASQTVATILGGQHRAASDAAASAQSTVAALAQSKIQSAANVALAGSGGVASMAAAPFPADLAAPEFGAAMAGVAATYALASGGYDIPAGVNPIVQAHAQEMILPAHLANPLRAALAGGKGMSGGSSGMEGMQLHIHATDADSFKKMLDNNSGHLMKSIRRELGNGALLRTGR